jgi:hypothetical protein
MSAEGEHLPLPALPPLRPARAAAPFTRAELWAILLRPQRVLDLVFSERERLVATVAERRALGALVAVLLGASAAFALPYGAVQSPAGCWRVAATLLCALAVCFPSLHVFSAYLGLRLLAGQSLALALVITSVAALFTFGFFPILWFLQATMLQDSAVAPAQLSAILLAASLLFGIAHLYRCVPRMPGQTSYVLLTLVWQVLFVFITYRMALLFEVW